LQATKKGMRACAREERRPSRWLAKEIVYTKQPAQIEATVGLLKAARERDERIKSLDIAAARVLLARAFRSASSRKAGHQATHAFVVTSRVQRSAANREAFLRTSPQA
jgi:hypothetical protein